MARIKSTSPVGSPPRDVVADASILMRWLRAAAGDAAKALDLITGANGETPIDHTGAGLGCPLRMPLAAQHIDRSIALAGSGTEGDYYVVAVPVFVRAGEGSLNYRLRCTITKFGEDDVYAEVRNTSWVLTSNPTPGTRITREDPFEGRSHEVDGVRLTNIGSGAGDLVEWTIPLAAGLNYVLIKRACYLDDSDAGAVLRDWSLDHDRASAGNGNGLGTAVRSSAIGQIYGAHDVTSSMVVQGFFDEEIEEDGPFSAFVAARLNRLLNSLWERGLGAILPGNEDYESTLTWDNNQSDWTSEARLEFPLTVVALGAGGAGVGTINKPIVTPMDLTPVSGMTGWARYPTTHDVTMDPFCGLIMEVPSFDTSPSDLTAYILMEAPNGDTLDGTPGWRFDAIVDGLAAATEVSPVRIAATDYWLATVTAIPFTASATNRINLRIRHTTAAVLSKEVQLLGACLAFVP